jgi:hypothetical protein
VLSAGKPHALTNCVGTDTSVPDCKVAPGVVKGTGHRKQIIGWLVATIALGVAFLGFQITEYGHAYHDGLKLTSGIYGSTFYMLTGFHGFHVTLSAPPNQGTESCLA